MFLKRWKLFELFGFAVRVDASWFLVVLLVLWSLSAMLFPAHYPGLATGQYLLMGLTATLGLFASIVVHEFCHALVARRYGLPMRGITLFIFGGIAEMSKEPQTPKAEFYMAAAGPLASVALAVSFWLLHRLAIAAGWPPIVLGTFEYLWQINAVLVAFNMIPAFPLDGGRIVRSLLWRWKGKLRWATRISANFGAAFGFGLILLGIVSIFSGNLVGGLWYAAIGVFLRWAAKASYGNVLVREALEDAKVENLMDRATDVAYPEETLAELVNNHIYKYRHKTVPVVNHEGKLAGLVSTEQVRRVPRTEWTSKKVGEILERPSGRNSISKNANALRVFERLSQSTRDLFAVTSGDKFVGVLSIRDILNFLAIEMELNPPVDEDRHVIDLGPAVRKRA